MPIQRHRLRGVPASAFVRPLDLDGAKSALEAAVSDWLAKAELVKIRGRQVLRGLYRHHDMTAGPV